jgi:CDGSH-type Zn-finger protein
MISRDMKNLILRLALVGMVFGTLSPAVTFAGGESRIKDLAFLEGTTLEPLAFTPEKDHSAWLCVCKQTRKPPYCNGAHRHIDDSLVGTDGSE